MHEFVGVVVKCEGEMEMDTFSFVVRVGAVEYKLRPDNDRIYRKMKELPIGSHCRFMGDIKWTTDKEGCQSPDWTTVVVRSIG